MASVNTTQLQQINVTQLNIVDNKIESLTRELQDTRDENEKLKEEFDEHKQEIDQIKALLGVNKGPLRAAPSVSTNWERAARPDVLSIGVGGFCVKTSLKTSINKWLTDHANIDETQWKLEGPASGRNFDLMFHGAEGSPNTGELRANLANLSLRTEKSDGTFEWTKVYTEDPKGEQLELYISKDTSPKHNREAMLTKRLHKAFEKIQAKGKGFYFFKKLRDIRHKGKSIAKVVCSSFEEFEVYWMEQNFGELGIQKEAIKYEFSQHVGIALNHAWCI